MPSLSPEQQELARGRARQLFSFLKAYSERQVTLKRTLKEQDWSLRLRELPSHPSIVLGEVLLNARADIESEPHSSALLTVRRPKLIDAPCPPQILGDWLEQGWQQPDGEICVRQELHVDRGYGAEPEPFDAEAKRVTALQEWRTRWESWAVTERPARAAMQIFEKLYQLYSRIRLESERVELVLGDGQLRWQRGPELLDHPILLQRVELEFDPNVPELRLVDTDRTPELYTALLEVADDLAPEQLTLLRQDLEQRSYHPLEHEATAGFLQRLAHYLGSHGSFRDSPSGAAPGGDPVIERDAALFLRQRVAGYPAAFDRVLADLEHGTTELPASLIRLVGIEPPEEGELEVRPHSPWGEPPDILLSKPTNAEQIAIARALERHRAVQVQGPPGTGKSHTVANLIGHLVAHGKRVLVTSHTTKALSVLRNHIVEPLRPLAVAVLENDLEGRTQMEEAVKQILARLSESPDHLAADVARLTADRTALNAAIDKVTAQLQEARAAEYQLIAVAGEAYEPAEAARWVHDHREGNDWIPAPVAMGAPLPLTAAEIAELYATNSSLSYSEEDELEGGLPDSADIPNVDEFMALVAQAASGGEDERRYWAMGVEEAQLDELERLDAVLRQTTNELGRLASWEAAVVKAGHAGGTDVMLWEELAEQLRQAYTLWDRIKPLLLEYDPHLPDGVPSAQLVATYEAIAAHLGGGGSLGWFTLFTKTEWKQAIAGARVNDAGPSMKAHFDALKAEAELCESRSRLRARWGRQAVTAGLPNFDSFGDVPEPKLLPYTERLEAHLQSWPEWWSLLEQAMAAVGLQWRQVRDEMLANSGPADPFEHDIALITGKLPPLVQVRLCACRALRASRLLDELVALLAPYHGPAVSVLRLAVETQDPTTYAAALRCLEQLREKLPLFVQRREWLAKLEPAARAWAKALRERTGLSGAASVLGDATVAWRWRQLHQELERRAGLDERTLGRKLDQLRVDLRRTTAQLIERMAWKAQVERVDLHARQALLGWAGTQKKIGKGTGKRVPELRAEARRRLEDARDAVPVWIMPLSRVADSFQSSERRFDVVIVDEASQSDVAGLLAWYLGDRILVVGDDEQVSPLDVGQQVEATVALIAQYLGGIPNAHLYDGKTSIYDLAGQCFGGTIRLREHFRCVPAIIEFSNRLSYHGEIRPLRNPASAPEPHVVEYIAPTSIETRKDGKRNLMEARIVVALFQAMTENALYRGKTFGAISLLGDEQAGLIQELALSALGAVELEARRFAAGNAAQFQGDERDVMLLSLVDVPTGYALPLRQTQLFKQRYNVAASRAKDQLWLVHSLDPDRDLKAGDLRRELIAHVRDPEARLRKQREAAARAESPFEVEVIKRLIATGYEVTPQVWVGNYRIDLVVGSGQRQAAVECDGDRYHGVDQIPNDMARQAILERAGWRFVRIRGTRFYRDPDEAMAWVVSELAKLGVEPSSTIPEVSDCPGAELREMIIRRAWEIMQAREWIPTLPVAVEMSGGSPI